MFTSSQIWRKDEVKARTAAIASVQKTGSQEGVKPESLQKEKPPVPGKQDVLLAEQTVSNKEQRKADWAIIRDMAKYLWPKDDLGTRTRVGLSVALLVGSKVGSHVHIG